MVNGSASTVVRTTCQGVLVPAFVRSSSACMCLIAVLNISGCKRKVRIRQVGSFEEIQIYTYHNACNSFPLWDRVGWPSGSTSPPLFSAPERDGLNTVSLLFQLLLKSTHYKNTTLSLRAKIPLCVANVPLQTADLL